MNPITTKCFLALRGPGFQQMRDKDSPDSARHLITILCTTLEGMNKSSQ